MSKEPTADEMAQMLADGDVVLNAIAIRRSDGSWCSFLQFHKDGDDAPNGREIRDGFTALLGTQYRFIEEVDRKAGGDGALIAELEKELKDNPPTDFHFPKFDVQTDHAPDEEGGDL